MDALSIRQVIVKLMDSEANLDDPFIVRVVMRDEHGSVNEAHEAGVYFVGGIHGYVVVEDDKLTKTTRH
jgi:hypothetical protein